MKYLLLSALAILTIWVGPQHMADALYHTLSNGARPENLNLIHSLSEWASWGMTIGFIVLIVLAVKLVSALIRVINRIL